MNNTTSFKNIEAPANSLESVARCFNTMGLDFGYCTVGEIETKKVIVL